MHVSHTVEPDIDICFSLHEVYVIEFWYSIASSVI